jgi:hypothetical protein
MSVAPDHPRRPPRRILATSFAAIAMLGSASVVNRTSTDAPATSAGAADDYSANLAMIRAASVRNTNHDASPYRDTPQSELRLDDHLGSRTDYLNNPGGNPEQSFPVLEGGQFRAACEFSHFAYDDPIVSPGKPGQAHLHMFWGNTDVNAYSTYDSLINSGSSTCNGQEMNRTGYWAPAMFDNQGNVRIPERIIVYYKGYGQARDEAVAYPPGAAMVQTENLHAVSWNEGGLADPSGGPNTDLAFNCSDQFRGARAPASNTIPVCDGSKYFNEYGVTDNPHATLEMKVKFGNCWNGDDPANPANWGKANVGGWFYSECEQRTTTPNLEYIIAYPLEVGETTEGWFLSSDVDAATRQVAPGGSTVHADWWGGWNKQVNDLWLNNCTKYVTSQPSDCGFGYLTDGGPDGNNPLPGPALKIRPQYDGPMKVSASTLFGELCPGGHTVSTPADAAYCNPNGTHHSPSSTSPATTAPATTSPATVPATAAPVTTAPSTTAAPVTTAPPATTSPAPGPSPQAPKCAGHTATVVGTKGNDVLIGGSGADVIVGGGGDDIIRGAGGDDIICGNAGADVLLGDGGNDRLYGGSGDDRLFGGDGTDTCSGGTGSDIGDLCERSSSLRRR